MSDNIKIGNIFMMKKNKNGKWQDNNKITYENLDSFENINDKIEHQVGDLSTSLESAITTMNYKIDKAQLTIFG